ncbi:hypothetical protein OUZ56_007994 [Daphnia magna]|uniref:Uncharacterized protein n=1 Tax=Daphnia magna TaxID=35525 RepID=A0ABR0ABL9_9CRUS|nr:hypothetical protein OUZ56_007994 [Daphnia magna]
MAQVGSGSKHSPKKEKPNSFYSIQVTERKKRNRKAGQEAKNAAAPCSIQDATGSKGPARGTSIRNTLNVYAKMMTSSRLCLSVASLMCKEKGPPCVGKSNRPAGHVNESLSTNATDVIVYSSDASARPLNLIEMRHNS